MKQFFPGFGRSRSRNAPLRPTQRQTLPSTHSATDSPTFAGATGETKEVTIRREPQATGLSRRLIPSLADRFRISPDTPAAALFRKRSRQRLWPAPLTLTNLLGFQSFQTRKWFQTLRPKRTAETLSTPSSEKPKSEILLCDLLLFVAKLIYRRAAPRRFFPQ